MPGFFLLMQTKNMFPLAPPDFVWKLDIFESPWTLLSEGKGSLLISQIPAGGNRGTGSCQSSKCIELKKRAVHLGH